MTGRRKHVAAILVALGLAMAGCGGDDGGDDAPRTSAQAEQAPASETRTPTTGSEDRSKPEQTGESQSGGSTAPAGANATPTDDDASPGEKSGDPGTAKKRKSRPKPATSIEDLPPAQRRKLHRDLYQQGKQLCGAYGPDAVAKSFNLPSSDPTQLARQLAERYEAGNPSLVLPYQQGCIAGFRAHARKARNAGDGTGG